MPKQIEERIRAEYKKKGLSGRKLDSAVYGTLNNAGFMHGSKETERGKQAERKYERDHSK